MAKAIFNRKKTLLMRKLELILRKKSVECCIWSIVLFGAESWTLWEVIWKVFKCGAGEGCRRSVGLTA
jgi:glucose dehydrogenase